MKRILFIVLILANLPAMSQQIRKTVVVQNYAMSKADTTFKLSTSDNYTWGMIVQWSGVGGGTNATITVRVSYDGTNWIDYNGGLTYTMTAASGRIGFEDFQTAFNYIGVRVQRNTSTGGSLSIFLTADPN